VVRSGKEITGGPRRRACEYLIPIISISLQDPVLGEMENYRQQKRIRAVACVKGAGSVCVVYRYVGLSVALLFRC
jgi:hypothetical protein